MILTISSTTSTWDSAPPSATILGRICSTSARAVPICVCGGGVCDAGWGEGWDSDDGDGFTRATSGGGGSGDDARPGGASGEESIVGREGVNGENAVEFRAVCAAGFAADAKVCVGCKDAGGECDWISKLHSRLGGGV